MEGLREKGIELAEMDVSRGESVVGAVKEILAAKGHIDVLLCNAGKLSPPPPHTHPLPLPGAHTSYSCMYTCIYLPPPQRKSDV